MQQVSDALQLHLPAAIGTLDDPEIEEPLGTSTSMRQGYGIGAADWVAGWVDPFCGQLGGRRPGWDGLAHWPSYPVRSAIGECNGWQCGVSATVDGNLQTIAGLSPNAPGWLAAGLSALGVWVNQPLSWLTAWISLWPGHFIGE